MKGKFLTVFQVLHSEPKQHSEGEGRTCRKGAYDLPELISKLGIKRIWLTNRHGLLTPGEVNALYKLCHIYVLSSFSEGFGLPMLEALRFHKPVVAVDAPPFNEIIEHGKTGILIPCMEVQAS